MTMFGKGAWTIFNLDAPELNLINHIKDGWRDMPMMAKSIALSDKSQAIGIAPFCRPRLGDADEFIVMLNGKADTVTPGGLLDTLATDQWVYTSATNTIESATTGGFNLTANGLWDNNPDSWKIAEGVYAFWLISFEWSDVHDINSKKEGLAYEYGSPFKFQPAEIKATITEEAEKLDTIVRKQYQVIIDFNLSRIWINSASKTVVGGFIGLMAEMGVPVVDFRPESYYGMDPQWTETFLKKLYDTSEYKNEFLGRAAEIKMHGVAGVQPSEDRTMDKILKNYFSFSEVGSDFLALSGPLSVRLCPTVASTIALKTPYEATELLSADESLLLHSAPVTFCKLFEKVTATGSKQILIKRFSVEVNDVTMIPEFPGFIVKGLNIDNFKNSVKQELKALDRPLSTQEYWNLWYTEMNTAVFEYLNIVKETM